MKTSDSLLSLFCLPDPHPGSEGSTVDLNGQETSVEQELDRLEAQDISERMKRVFEQHSLMQVAEQFKALEGIWKAQKRLPEAQPFLDIIEHAVSGHPERDRLIGEFHTLLDFYSLVLKRVMFNQKFGCWTRQMADYIFSTTDKDKNLLPSALLYIDLDGLKHVNDTYGTEAGDQLMRYGVAELLNSVHGPNVAVERRKSERPLAHIAFQVHSGDEFALYCTRKSKEEALAMQQRLHQYLQQNSPYTIFVDGRSVKLPLSAKSAVQFSSAENWVSVSEMLHRADAEIKQQRENRPRVS